LESRGEQVDSMETAGESKWTAWRQQGRASGQHGDSRGEQVGSMEIVMGKQGSVSGQNETAIGKQGRASATAWGSRLRAGDSRGRQGIVWVASE
jgi:hypothetical protein